MTSLPSCSAPSPRTSEGNGAARPPGRKIVVFCGARTGAKPRYIEDAAHLGGRLSRDGWTVVTGGGGIGLMNAVTVGAKQAGGYTEGVTPSFLNDLQPVSPFLDSLRMVDDLFERKRIMLDEALAGIALPGGMGTLDEIGDFATLGQIKQHRKPLFIVDTDGYWEPLFGLLEHMVAERFLESPSHDLLVRVADVDELMERLREFFPQEKAAAAAL